VVRGIGDVVRENPESYFRQPFRAVPTAVDNMSPLSPFVKALSDMPIADGVRTHSIIAALGDGPLSGRTDGVVRYDSAHLDGVVSEKIVHTSHSTQAAPETIEEVRRILRALAAEGPRVPR
jgi:hypothetical protein